MFREGRQGLEAEFLLQSMETQLSLATQGMDSFAQDGPPVSLFLLHLLNSHSPVKGPAQNVLVSGKTPLITLPYPPPTISKHIWSP